MDGLLGAAFTEGLRRLLETFSRSFFTLPAPADFALEEEVHSMTLGVRIQFVNPEIEHLLNFDLTRLRREPEGRLPRRQNFENVLPSLIMQAIHDHSRDEDQALLGTVMRSLRDSPDMTAIVHGNLVRELQDSLAAYYREDRQDERYFSLRPLEDYEHHYAAYGNFAPYRTTMGEMVGMIRHPPRLLPNREAGPGRITAQQETVAQKIREILTDREDPRYFTDRANRCAIIRRAERPYLEELRDHLRRERGRRLYGARSRYPTATEVRARTEDQNRRIAAINDPIAARLWSRQIREHYEQNPHVFMGWDLAGEPNRPNEQAEVEARGMALLMENLTPQQKADYAKQSSFYVIGGKTGHHYEIARGKQQNVWRVDPKTKEKMQGYCFLPAGNLCVGDTLLTQKIALELHEEEALKVAHPFGNSNYDRPYYGVRVDRRRNPIYGGDLS